MGSIIAARLFPEIKDMILDMVRIKETSVAC